MSDETPGNPCSVVRGHERALGSHNSLHNVQLVLCFRGPVYRDTLSFTLSGHFNQEKMPCGCYFSVDSIAASALFIGLGT